MPPAGHYLKIKEHHGSSTLNFKRNIGVLSVKCTDIELIDNRAVISVGVKIVVKICHNTPLF